ncbi:unnamed protein product [Miscanthus lutarioriparius]|uniref:Major facilitator superfamily (MFS) profile domain-containing protein n=1 Tax=Miscanthus lutarioriparius TaxID=422564 RepID=A0A811Q2T4_9POAL|nr:unnamed protein product [Miscanthus lutarioriparius]
MAVGPKGGEDARQYGCRRPWCGGIFGYDISTAGGVLSMDAFLQEFSRTCTYCKSDSQLLTLFTPSLYITGLLTAVLLVSWLTTRHGCRPSMILGGVAYLVGAAVSCGTGNVFMAILGRALLGVGLGFANQIRFKVFYSDSKE